MVKPCLSISLIACLKLNKFDFMTQYLSDKLRVLSLFSIILVLYIHSGFHSYEIQGMEMNDCVQRIVSGMLGRCAVPLFYIISGYLFFLKVPEGMQSIYGKMRKRARTLVVPYLIGCLFFVGFLAFVEVLPGTSRFMNGGIMHLFDKPLDEIICSVFYDAGDGSPCAFQLWFLRDLIIIVATLPLWYWCLRRMGWIFVVLAFAITYIAVPHVPLKALFWFVLGGQLTSYKLVLGGGKRSHRKMFVTGTFCALGYLMLSFCQLMWPEIIKWSLVDKPVIMMGIIGLWWLYDAIVGRSFVLSAHRWFATACQYTFFIYLFHEPTLNIVRKLIVLVLGKNEIGYMASYLLSPWLFVACSVFIGIVLRQCCGKVYGVCVGGR